MALMGASAQFLGCSRPAQNSVTQQSQSGASSNSSGNKRLKGPRIALTSPTQPSFVYTLAGPMEYGSRFGLEFQDGDITTFESHAVATQAALAGRMDVVGGSTISHLTLVEQGKPFKIFAPFINTDDFVLAVRNNVKNIDDLIKPETRVAVDSPGGAGNTIFDAMLMAAGAKFRVKDIPNVTILESSGLRATAFASNNIDATVIHLAQFEQAKAQAGETARILASLYETTPHYVKETFAAPSAWIDSHLEEAAALNKALITAARELTASYELFKQMVRKYIAGGGPDEQVLKSTWELIRKYDFWPVNGGLDDEGIAFMIDLAYESGLIKKKLDVAQCVDRRPLEAALKDIGRIDKSQLLK